MSAVFNLNWRPCDRASSNFIIVFVLNHANEDGRVYFFYFVHSYSRFHHFLDLPHSCTLIPPFSSYSHYSDSAFSFFYDIAPSLEVFDMLGGLFIRNHLSPLLFSFCIIVCSITVSRNIPRTLNLSHPRITILILY